MGISVYMFCPRCRLFVSLQFRDPLLTSYKHLRSESQWGNDDGAFSVGASKLLQDFVTHQSYFPTGEPNSELFKKLVVDFIRHHAHHYSELHKYADDDGENERILFLNSYNPFYMWEPGRHRMQASWWHWQEIAIIDQQLPYPVPGNLCNLLPSHLVKHMRFERFSDVLNYLIDRWPLKSLDEARNWPYINSLFWGVQEWLIDPEEGGKPQPIAPCTSLVDHCVDAIQKVKDKKQLSLVGSLTLPQHLAQKLWHTFAQAYYSRQHFDEKNKDYGTFDLYTSLASMFAPSLPRIKLTPVVLNYVHAHGHSINELLIKMAATPGALLKELHAPIAHELWKGNLQLNEERNCLQADPSLRTLTMVMMRCLQPQMKRWILIGCGALTDESIISLDDIDGDYVWCEMLSEQASPLEDEQEQCNRPKKHLRRKAQDWISPLIARLRDEATSNRNLLNGPYDLKELDISACYSLTGKVTHHMVHVFPRLQRLRMCDMKFIPFINTTVTSETCFKHLVELDMNAALFKHEPLERSASKITQGGKEYFARLAELCPNLKTLRVSFWEITDDELALIIAGMAHLESLEVMGSSKITNYGLEKVDQLLRMTGRTLEELNIGSCSQVSSLRNLIGCIRHIKAINLSGLGKKRSWLCDAKPEGNEEDSVAMVASFVESVDLRMASWLQGEALMEFLREVKSLKQINIYGCYTLSKATVMQAAQEYGGNVKIMSGGYYS